MGIRTRMRNMLNKFGIGNRNRTRNQYSAKVNTKEQGIDHERLDSIVHTTNMETVVEDMKNDMIKRLGRKEAERRLEEFRDSYTGQRIYNIEETKREIEKSIENIEQSFSYKKAMDTSLKSYNQGYEMNQYNHELERLDVKEAEENSLEAIDEIYVSPSTKIIVFRDSATNQYKKRFVIDGHECNEMPMSESEYRNLKQKEIKQKNKDLSKSHNKSRDFAYEM